MADVQQRTVTTERHEFYLATPTNVAEVGKAYAVAKQHAEALGVDTSFDDSIRVDTGDDEVVLFFEVVTRRV